MKKGLKQGIKEFMLAGRLAESNNLLIAAADSYFKALIHAIDLSLFEKLGKIPDSHAERFRTLEKKDKKIYDITDSLFNLYRKSYRSSISSLEFREIKDGLRKTLQLTKLEKEFGSYLEKG